MLARRGERERRHGSEAIAYPLPRGRSRRTTTAAFEVLWALRHLRALGGIDWSVAERDPQLIAILDRAFAGFHDRYFRMEVHGWDNVTARPALLVGNHSGFGVAELLMLLVAWY